jgi:hypothetical protein
VATFPDIPCPRPSLWLAWRGIISPALIRPRSHGHFVHRRNAKCGYFAFSFQDTFPHANTLRGLHVYALAILVDAHGLPVVRA